MKDFVHLFVLVFLSIRCRNKLLHGAGASIWDLICHLLVDMGKNRLDPPFYSHTYHWNSGMVAVVAGHSLIR
ncbi:Uncharacterized protein APZ42_032262 [Daphnia magna]|uniref:Secreted protein n=1 Tax=Daphnia magna TaxID=35525 RepID=A0A164M4Y5_9CRUS|nr:Uncharacterized protein APZ42_032262 [Daphnia magna]